MGCVTAMALNRRSSWLEYYSKFEREQLPLDWVKPRSQTIRTHDTYNKNLGLTSFVREPKTILVLPKHLPTVSSTKGIRASDSVSACSALYIMRSMFSIPEHDSTGHFSRDWIALVISPWWTGTTTARRPVKSLLSWNVSPTARRNPWCTPFDELRVEMTKTLRIRQIAIMVPRRKQVADEPGATRRLRILIISNIVRVWQLQMRSSNRTVFCFQQAFKLSTTHSNVTVGSLRIVQHNMMDFFKLFERLMQKVRIKSKYRKY